MATLDWNARFDTDDYVFGRAPSQFLKRRVALLRAGMSALLVADGEGRNSVWLAEQGLAVRAFDPAPTGVAKAQRLAAERGVSIETEIADVESFDWDATQYDLVVGIFIQFAGPALRAAMFGGMLRALKPGGLLLLHGYTPKQLDYGTGGPPYVENLYTEALLRDAFGVLEIEELIAYERELQEGAGHAGMSALIDLTARKQAAERP
ncbi:MAG: class I SAM-dependent methyltransferase [Pseudomonadota bacterium]